MAAIHTASLLVLLACDLHGHAQPSPTVYYSDWIDSAHVAMEANDPHRAAHFYRKAFERRPPLAMHALKYARVAWQLHDTTDTHTYALRALDLGIRGDEIAGDSLLATYWSLTAAKPLHDRWATYAAMDMPELRAELEAMFKEDQDIRMKIDWEKADSQDSLVRRAQWIPVEEQDARHYRRVVEIIKEHGIPSVHQVGLTGNKMIFFAFIHANTVEDITPWVLHLHRSVQRGDSPGTWYAYVIDRVMVRTSKVTMFGTTSFLDRTDGVNYEVVVLGGATLQLLREQIGLPRTGRKMW